MGLGCRNLSLPEHQRGLLPTSTAMQRYQRSVAASAFCCNETPLDKYLIKVCCSHRLPFVALWLLRFLPDWCTVLAFCQLFWHHQSLYTASATYLCLITPGIYHPGFLSCFLSPLVQSYLLFSVGMTNLLHGGLPLRVAQYSRPLFIASCREGFLS